MRLRPLRQQWGVRGLSLIELLVGMALSLLAIVAIYQVLAVWDARRRTITAGSSAQISGSIGVSEMERDLQLSGMGFGNAPSATIGCTVAAYNSTLATNTFDFKFAPVIIDDAGDGTPDVVRVLYGNSSYVVNIQKFNFSSLNGKTLQYRTGFNAGDLVVVAGNTPRNCRLFEVTGNDASDLVSIEHGTTSYTSFYTGAAKIPTMNSGLAGATFTSGEIYNLGPGAQLTEWRVNAGVLTRQNLLRDTAASDVTEGIVDLQAQYGVDTNGNGKVDTGEWVDAGASTDLTKVLAVRVAVLARGSQFENTVPPANPVTTVAPSWAARAFVMKNLDGTAGSAAPAALANDWHHYRYRVYETVVPLRNMLWGATS